MAVQVRPPVPYLNDKALVYAKALLYQAFIFFGRKILVGKKGHFDFVSRFCGYVFGVIWRKGVQAWQQSKPARVKKALRIELSLCVAVLAFLNPSK